MKRQLLHPKCCTTRLGVPLNDPKLSPLDLVMMAAEETHRVYGKSHRSFRCDSCGKIIDKGVRVVAESIVGLGQTYFKWEDQYLERD